jgi:hypothetical protein
MIQKQVIKHILDLTGINVNTKSRKREIVEMKAVYSTILRNKNQTFQSIGNAIGLGHCSVIHLCKIYPLIKNDYLIDIQEKVLMLLDGMSIDLILLQQEKRKVEEQKAKVEVEKQSKIDPFFENLIKLANENSDVMFKLETFYKINNQIYNKNES